jgi:hypothetical protein
MTARLPVVSPLGPLLERLAREERQLSQELSELESRLRVFEERDRPAFERWLRLEFGPELSLLEEVTQRVRERGLFATRVQEGVAQGMLPREALYVAMGLGGSSAQARQSFAEAAEVEARRQAKREAKRDARKEARKAERIKAKELKQKAEGVVASSGPSRLTQLYRRLARVLHPDSSKTNLDASKAKKLWLEVQAAYTSRSFERLLAISAWLSSDGERQTLTHVPGSSLSERFERLRALARSKAKLSDTLLGLSTDPAWEFNARELATRKRRTDFARHDIRERLARMQAVLDEIDEFIESVGPPRAPRR